MTSIALRVPVGDKDRALSPPVVLQSDAGLAHDNQGNPA